MDKFYFGEMSREIAELLKKSLEEGLLIESDIAYCGDSAKVWTRYGTDRKLRERLEFFYIGFEGGIKIGEKNV